MRDVKEVQKPVDFLPRRHAADPKSDAGSPITNSHGTQDMGYAIGTCIASATGRSYNRGHPVQQMAGVCSWQLHAHDPVNARFSHPFGPQPQVANFSNQVLAQVRNAREIIGERGLHNLTTDPEPYAQGSWQRAGTVTSLLAPAA